LAPRASVGTLAAATSALTVATYLIAFVFSISVLFSTSIGLDLFHSPPVSLILGVFLYETRLPLQANALTVYFGTVLVFLTCFVLAFREDGGIVSGLRKLAEGKIARQVPNWFAIMPLVSSSLLLLVVLIVTLENSVGLPTGSLLEDRPYVRLYSLAYASVVEEAAFRISVLGLLVAARASWHSYASGGTALAASTTINRRVRLVFLGLLFPDQAKLETGLQSFRVNGWSGIHWSEWAMLCATSIWFGLLHLLGGGGWQVGKVASASLQGFAIGIAFMVYGAYASILFHWYFDVYFYVTFLAPAVLGNIVSLLIWITGILGFWILARAFLEMTRPQNGASRNGLYPAGQSSISAEA